MMCSILDCLDGTIIESCGELRAQGYTIEATDYTDDDCCLCNVDIETILNQKPERQWEWDPFGYRETGHGDHTEHDTSDTR